MKVEYVEETSVKKALSFEIEPELVEKEIDAKTHADLLNKLATQI